MDEKSFTYNLFHGKSLFTSILRLIIFGPIGCGIGYLFWIFSLDENDVITGLARDLLMWSIVGAFGLGCAFVPIVRCLSFITLITMMFGEGQAIVHVSLMIGIQEKLVDNLMNNYYLAKEVMKCNMKLAENFSRTRYNIVNKPTKDMIFNMAAGAQESQRVVGSVEDLFEPLDKELVDDEETLREKSDDEKRLARMVANDIKENQDAQEKLSMEKLDREEIERDEGLNRKFKTEIARSYSKKSLIRCESIFVRAHDACYGYMYDKFTKCVIIVVALGTIITGPIGGVVCYYLHPARSCWLLKLLHDRDAQCYEGNYGIPNRMKELEKELVDAAETCDEVLSQFEANIQFEAQIPKYRMKVYSVAQAFSRIDAHFAGIRTFVEIVKVIFKVIRLIAVAWVLYKTYGWIKSYLKNVTHENILITGQFKSINLRRKFQNRQHFDKFRKFELKKVNLVWWKPRMSHVERTRLLKGVFDLIYLAAFIVIFTTATTTFYDVLYSVYKYSHFTAQQVGYHELTVTVNGTGFMAKMISSIINDFNTTAVINQTLDNENCRQIPLEIDWSIPDGVPWIWILYGILCVQKILFAYLVRVRLVFASICFPYREYTRVLWLYNKMLEVRVKKFFHAKEAMENWVDEPDKIPEESEVNFWLRFSPTLCFFLKFFTKQPCHFCEDDTKNSKNKKHYCEFHHVYFCDSCLATYPCFHQCYACLVLKWRKNFEAPTTAVIDSPAPEFQRVGFLICRESFNGSWQFLLLQSNKNPLHWSPPKGAVNPNSTPLETAIKITENDTGLHCCYEDNPVATGSGHACDYTYFKQTEDCVVYAKAKGLENKKVTYWVAIVADPDVNIILTSATSKHKAYDWFDVERACKLAFYQNSPLAFLKADYFLRKAVPKW